MRLKPEEELSIACADWITLKRASDDRYELAFTSNNERAGRPHVQRLWNQKGRRKGVSDWLIMCPSKTGKFSGACIELKAGKNKATKEQRAFLDVAAKHGNFCAVVYSFQDFEELVTSYFDVL